MAAPVCVSTAIPTSAPLPPPLQAVCGSACPVMVKPFNSSVTFGAPMAIQGASLTTQVTSSTSSLSSVMVSVLEMVPPIPAVCPVLADTASVPANATNQLIGL